MTRIVDHHATEASQFDGIPDPMARALRNEQEALRQRQMRAAEELMGLPIPRDLRSMLRAFHAGLEPVIIEHERTAAA